MLNKLKALFSTKPNKELLLELRNLCNNDYMAFVELLNSA